MSSQGEWQLVTRRKGGYQDGGSSTLALNATQVTIYEPFKSLFSPCMLTPPSLRLTHEDNKPGSGLVSLLVSPLSLSLTLLLS